ncbi:MULTISPECIES: hypothetical protein [unclassified Clostridium]|uniref:hypothetical protein n=1 Tax=unclassified Clostridium TaxID=2614128 RepID=UPI0025BF4F2B|nr:MULTISPECIES: hypothetical protein [unclassified Clostridium]
METIRGHRAKLPLYDDFILSSEDEELLNIVLETYKGEIFMNNEINTKTVVICNNHYCYYCGKRIEPYTRYHDREEWTYYSCNCEQAKKELLMKDELKKENRRHEQELRDIRNKYKNILVEYVGKKDLEYKIKLEKLNKEYKK